LATSAVELRTVPRPASGFARVTRGLRGTPLALAGVVIVGVFFIVAVAGPLFTPYSPLAFSPERLAAPSPAHIFGTDSFGRDVFSRVVAGARLSFLIASVATACSLIVGVPLGLISGYRGGWLDEAVMRVMDALLSLPSLVLALVIVGTLGGGFVPLVLAIAVVYSPRIARVVRSGVLALREEDFVVAAHARGESTPYILISEILPNTVGPVIIEASIRMGFAIMLTTSLSYLGLGVSPPQPDWGLMINESRPDMFAAPWVVIFPALAIGSAIIGFNMLGDGIRDVFDPRREWSDRKGEVG
jgi:peptide/nickel transport system permease protein